MRSLRTRLILSHVLPLLIVIPMVGVALTYLLETQVFLAGLSTELEQQARLVALVVRDYPQIWYDADQAQALLARISPQLSAKVMFFDRHEVLLASSDPDDAERIGQVIDVPGLTEALVSRTVVRVDYGEQPGTGAADVLLPVLAPTFQTIGVVRLTDPLSSVYERFPRTRSLITGVLVGGLLIGVIAGWLLALDLARPLQAATVEVSQMTDGEPLAPLPEEGPEEVRMLLRAFNGLTTQIRNLEKSRRRLLANLVHELGRPLGAFLSATQALAAGAHEDPALRQDLLAGMEAETQRMQRLLDDLTRLYDQTLGPLELDRQPTLLSPWLTRVLSPWREAAQEKDLDWETEIPEDLPAPTIDADRMAQAVGNVVSNAVKYTPPGGTVTVRAAAADGHVRVSVHDTGIGIPPEEQARIFEPFYRGPASRRFPQGMGLGLSIARDLVAAHGGRIEIESAVGEGTVFTIWLPVGE